MSALKPQIIVQSAKSGGHRGHLHAAPSRSPSRAHLFSQPPGIYHATPALSSSSRFSLPGCHPFPKSGRTTHQPPTERALVEVQTNLERQAPSAPRTRPRAASGCRAPPGEPSRRRSIRFLSFARFLGFLGFRKVSVLGFKSSNLEAVGGVLLGSW
jgi:hypothetical protein